MAGLLGSQWPWYLLIVSFFMCSGNAAAIADSESVFLASVMMENHAMVLATAQSRVTPPYIAEETFVSSK